MTTRTFTIEPGDSGQHHTVLGGTIAHSGPAAGCTLPGCEQTPDTDPQAARWARREPLLVLLSRMQRGVLLPQERDLLRAAVQTELADGDQAREQLAARSGTLTASDVLVQHDVTRKALCDALDAGYHLNWQQLVDTAQRHHDANAEWKREAEQHRKALAEALDHPADRSWPDLIASTRILRTEVLGSTRARADAEARDAVTARQGEAEAIRAREAAEREAENERKRTGSAIRRATVAEAGERHAMGQRQQMAAERYAWQERGDRAEISTRAHKTAAAEALERAERAEQALHRVQGDWRRAYRAWQNARRRARELATLHDVRTQEAKGWHARAEKAERDAKRAERRCEDLRAESLRRGKEKLKHAESARAATARAERAEATLTAVRALLPDDPRDDKWTDHVTATAVRAALGDPRPATEPTPAVCCVCGCPDVTYRNCNDQPFCCRCAMCCDPPKPCTHGCQPPTCPAQNTATPDRVAHCDLPAHHDEDHHDSTVPGVLRWTDDVAVYPATAEPKPPAPALPVVTCGPITTHAAHQYMTGRTVYQCPGLTVTDLREQAAPAPVFTLFDGAKPAEPLRTPVIDAAAREIVNAAWRVLFGRR